MVSLRVHKRFRELRPDLIPKQMTEDDAVAIPIPYESVEKLPELRVVPITDVLTSKLHKAKL